MGLWKRSDVPIVPGETPPRPIPVEACDACGSAAHERARTFLDGTESLVLCLDPVTCGRRYRGGLTHYAYGIALRAQARGLVGAL